MSAVKRKKPLERWYKWRTRHAHGRSSWQYSFGTRAEVAQVADDESDGLRGYDLRAIKAPPAEWLEGRIESTLYQEKALARHRWMLRSTLASLP